MRVAVTTTPGPGADRLGRLLAAELIEPVFLPCIRIEIASVEVLDSLRAAAREADWIVLTSRRTVEVLWPEGDLPSAPSVAAVGSSTAEAARSAGGRVSVTGEGGAAGLGLALEGRVDGQRVVFPHARAADPELGRRLEAFAARVDAGWVYETVPIAPSDDEVDMAIFGSPSAVDGWRLARSLRGVALAAMGATTAGHLESIGHPATVVPDRPGYESLVAALVSHFDAKERISR